MNDNTQTNTKQSNSATKIGYAVGGFIAGAATGVAATTAAQTAKGNPPENDSDDEEGVINTEPQNETDGQDEIQTVTDEQQPQQQEQQPQHQEQQDVVETSLYAPIAHVSDNMTFAQAFAEARRQVGPGGVFEWRGNVYGTYYAEEWQNMSAAERAEYHSHIDYQAAHDEHMAYFGNEGRTNPNPQPNPDDNKTKSDEEKIDVDPDEPVKVLTIQQVDCEYGKDGKAIIAEVTIDGQEAVLMDLNNDGHFDALLVDLDNDGLLSEYEIIDVRDWNVELADLAEKYNGEINVVINEQPTTGMDSVVVNNADYNNEEDVELA